MESSVFGLWGASGLSDLLATPVVAQEAGGSAFGGLIPLVLIFVAFYFFAIRPQQKRAKAQRELVGSIGVGDRIVTLGGIHGRVESLDDDTIRLEVAPGTTITVVRSAVGRRVVDATTGVDDE
jgi:preprotein translocase subunit YajC